MSVSGGVQVVATRVAADLVPPRAFDDACRMVVNYLADLVPMGFWGVSRVVGGRQTMLLTIDRAYGGLAPGTEIAWSTSLCRTMSTGTTPRVVPDTSVIPDLADAVGAQASSSVTVAAYVGTPILHPDGELFGTVVGLSPHPLPGEAVQHEGLLDLLSSLLSSVLEADSMSVESARALERAVSEAETDALTGLLNRRGWDRWLVREEDRFRRFGDPAAVVMMDLDGLKRINDTEGHEAGDRLIRRTADTLAAVVRPGDPLARLGGDEFGLVASAGGEDLPRLVDRLQAALLAEGVACSMGAAPYRVGAGFAAACAAADAAMYEDKRTRTGHGGVRPTFRGAGSVLTETVGRS